MALPALTKFRGQDHYQGRYKSFTVQSNSYYLTLMRYVECNPLKAGLVKKAEDWPWSSYAIRTTKIEKPITLSDGPVPAVQAMAKNGKQPSRHERGHY